MNKITPPLNIDLLQNGKLTSPWYIYFQQLGIFSGNASSVQLSGDNPKMAGSASSGISDKASRSDHVHPHDDTKASRSELSELEAIVNALETPVIPPDRVYFHEKNTSQDFTIGVDQQMVIMNDFTIDDDVHIDGELFIQPSTPSTGHNNTLGLQGGTTSEYYHMSLTDYNNVMTMHAQIMKRLSLGF